MAYRRSRADADVTSGPLRVELRNTQHEQMSSALPPTTDIEARYVSLVPSLVALDHRSGFSVLKKLEFLRAN